MALRGALVSALSLAAGVPGHGAPGNEAAGEIRLLRIEGVINPLSARYFKREMDRASREGSHAVVLELDTPGGLESSMREMLQTMLASGTPVVVYVGPRGARAASAGMFLTMGGHVAAMAPGTNIGAAHPVALGGSREQAPDETMKEKAVNDAAALARSVAAERGRNAAWAEEAVRKSASITVDEAIRMNVVDLSAADVDDLLGKLEGREVSLRSGTVVLRTAAARLVERRMSLPEKALHVITDPNIAYLLISIGFIGIVAELYAPGLGIPGAVGAISLLLGFVAVGSLPVGWAGLALLAIGIGLLLVEAQSPGVGLLGAAGVVAFVLGSLMLYSPLSVPSPAMPRASVSPWLVGGIAALLSAFVVAVLRAAAVARRRPPPAARRDVARSFGKAVTAIDPKGTVKVAGEDWSAVLAPGAETEKVRPGDDVEVVRGGGVVIQVRKLRQEPIEGRERRKTSR